MIPDALPTIDRLGPEPGSKYVLHSRKMVRDLYNFRCSATSAAYTRLLHRGMCGIPTDHLYKIGQFLL